MEETLEIRYVRPEDKAFWYSLDRHLPEAEFDKKTAGQRGYVLLAEGQRAGILRYNLFWDNTPFCTLLYIDPRFQRKEAQHFYRKLGYKDCGGLVVDIPGYEQPMELFLAKGIGKRSSF